MDNLIIIIFFYCLYIKININIKKYLKKGHFLMKNLKKVLHHIEKELDKKVDLTKSYENNDIDSLDAVSIIGIVEDKLNVTFSDKDLSQVKNFESLEEIISKKL